MKRFARMLRPSPALVIACIALFLAMGGVGYAALKGKDKKKVRAIADQEITKQAPGLSVANAANAANAAQRGQTRRNAGGRRPEVL